MFLGNITLWLWDSCENGLDLSYLHCRGFLGLQYVNLRSCSETRLWKVAFTKIIWPQNSLFGEGKGVWMFPYISRTIGMKCSLGNQRKCQQSWPSMPPAPMVYFWTRVMQALGKMKRPGFENFLHHTLSVLHQSSYLTSLRSISPSVNGDNFTYFLKRYLEETEWDTIHRAPTECITLSGVNSLANFFQLLLLYPHPLHFIDDLSVTRLFADVWNTFSEWVK